MKLVVLFSLLLLILIALSGSTLLRAAYSLFIVLVGISLFSSQEPLRQQLEVYRKELDRMNRICDELDQNTKIIVQTDLELTRTQEALDKKISGLYALHGLSKRILSVRSVAQLCQLITEATVATLGFEKAILCITDPEAGTRPAAVAQSGLEPDELTKPDLSRLLEMVGQPVLARGEPLLFAGAGSGSTPAADRALQRISTLAQMRSFAAVPLLLKGRPQGFLLAGTNPPYPDLEQSDVELTSILMSEVGVA
ncbi:MAG: GAF domain-containing protein, partial [Candidatus Omnitrophica bacterium]|nr:GAF domain-containing protein [Candidatus Omnitrophota bacterium]